MNLNLTIVNYGENRSIKNKINKCDERALRNVYKNESLTFHYNLQLDNSVTVHPKCLQKLPTEMYKVKDHLSPIPMPNLFTKHVKSYGLR